MAAPRCTPTPSTQSACSFVKGEPLGPLKVIGSWLGRSILVMPGVALAMPREARTWKRVVGVSAAASGMISVFLILYTAATSGPGKRRRK